MIENNTLNNTEKLLESAIRGMQEKKGSHIVDLNLGNIEHAVCTHFLICHGDSNRQVEAIAQSVQEFIKENTKENPWHKEGFQNADWILLDYADVVIHIFSKETRNFYNLEGLWADADITIIEE